MVNKEIMSTIGAFILVAIILVIVATLGIAEGLQDGREQGFDQACTSVGLQTITYKGKLKCVNMREMS